MRKQKMPTTTIPNKFDGDGRDDEYWRMRKYLLSCPSTQTLTKKAGVDAEMVLEILVHAHLMATGEGVQLVTQKALQVLEEAMLLISTELDEADEKYMSID